MMNNLGRKVVGYEDLPATNQSNQCKSLAGYIYLEEAPFWRLDKDNNIHVANILPSLQKSLREGFIKTLSHYAQTKSAGTTANYIKAFRAITKTHSHFVISPTNLINYRSSLSTVSEGYLGAIRAFLITWHELGYLGVDDDVIDLLRSWSLKRGDLGDAVQRMDPHLGPLTVYEQLAFNEGVVSAYEKKLISLSDMCLALIISQTGRRPIQIAALRIIDLDGSRKNKKGEPLYLLHIPRAKQKGAGFRGEFKTFSMTRELWILLNWQKEESIRQFEKTLGCKLDGEDLLEIPLFPRNRKAKNIMSLRDLRELRLTDKLHITSASITKILQDIANIANIHSERTGQILNVTAVRFRYTAGTGAARNGFGLMVIAEILDHSSTQNAHVYIKNIPEHVAALDAALGHQLAPLAQAFQGTLVDGESDASRGEDPSSRVRFKENSMGICGSYSFCGASVPIPCYTCINFQPLLDGPHEKIYDMLVAENERIFKITQDNAVASANNRTMIAVAQVIQMCKVRKEELGLLRVNHG